MGATLPVKAISGKTNRSNCPVFNLNPIYQLQERGREGQGEETDPNSSMSSSALLMDFVGFLKVGSSCRHPTRKEVIPSSLNSRRKRERKEAARRRLTNDSRG